MIISAYPVVVILNRFSMFFVKNQVMEVMPYMMRMGYFPMLFVMAVMPAFNEEFLCRGILYGAYRQRAKTTGIWLSALAFGLFHLNFNQMLYAVYLGIVLALMVEATGSIYTSMLMHFLLNGFNVTMNFMANQRLIADAAVNQQPSDGICITDIIRCAYSAIGDNGCCAGHFHLFKWHFDLQYLSDEWSKSAK